MKHRRDYEVIHEPGEDVSEEERIRPEDQLSRQERRWYALGALKSALLIGGIYIVGLGLIIALMVWIWF